MHHRQEVVHKFLFWAELFVIEHEQRTLGLLAEMGEEVESESCKAVLVRDHQRLDLSPQNPVDQPDKVWTLEIESPTDFLDVFDVGKPTSPAKCLDHPALIDKVWALGLRRDPAIRYCRSLFRRWHNAEAIVDLPLGIKPPARGSTTGLEYPLSIPPLQGFDCTTEPRSRFRHGIGSAHSE